MSDPDTGDPDAGDITRRRFGRDVVEPARKRAALLNSVWTSDKWKLLHWWGFARLESDWKRVEENGSLPAWLPKKRRDGRERWNSNVWPASDTDEAWCQWFDHQIADLELAVEWGLGDEKWELGRSELDDALWVVEYRKGQGLTDHTRAQMEEAFGTLSADAALRAIKDRLFGSHRRDATDLEPPAGASEQGDIKTPIRRRARPFEMKAYFACQYALAKDPANKTTRDAWNYLNEHGIDERDDVAALIGCSIPPKLAADLASYRVPEFSTFEPAVSKGRAAMNDPKHHSRAGRPFGKSVVHIHDLENRRADG